MEKVTIIIPVRNEEKYIAKCLKSVLQFYKPQKTKVEIFIIDGESTDKTLNIVKKISKKCNNIKVFKNLKKIQSAAVNIGILNSQGQWIMRLDAHSTYPKNYLLNCYRVARKTKAENVGGLFITHPGSGCYQALCVQALTTHWFGVGNSGFRTGGKEALADTVPYGFFHRSVFNKVGMIDERLVRAQDYEFNRRLGKMGGKIFRSPSIYINYYNQASLMQFYKKQIFYEAPYNAYMWYLAPYTFAFRHAITGLFVLGILGGLLLAPFWPRIIGIPFLATLIMYACLALFASIRQASRYNEPRHVIFLPFAFFLFHFFHGLGIAYGLLRLLTFSAPVQKIKEPWKGAGRFRVMEQT